MLHTFYTLTLHRCISYCIPSKVWILGWLGTSPGSPVIKTTPSAGDMGRIHGWGILHAAWHSQKKKKKWWLTVMQNLITSSQLKRMSLLLQVTDNLCSDKAVIGSLFTSSLFPGSFGDPMMMILARIHYFSKICWNFLILSFLHLLTGTL